MLINQTPVFGTILEQNPPVQPAAPRICFTDPRTGRWFGLDAVAANANSLYLGASGTGKTNAIKQHIDMLRAENDGSIFIFFDTKGDFVQDFRETGDYVMGNQAFCRLPGYKYWNLFKDILAAGSQEDIELAAQENAALIFEDSKNQSQPFFSNAAREVFTNILIDFTRHHREDRFLMTNGGLVRKIKTSPSSWYREIFSADGNEDMIGLLTCLGKPDTNMELGVLGEMKTVVYDCFKGIFAADDYDNSMSVREFIRNGSGRALFVEYSLNAKASQQKMFRLLIDAAIQEAMCRPENAAGNIYFVLDEMHLVTSELLSPLLHYGRSRKLTVIGGLQSVNQIHSRFEKEGGGKSAGQALLSGFPNVFAFRTDDFESRDYIMNLHGLNVVEYYYETESSTKTPVREREGHVVESWQIQGLDTGDTIASIGGKPPFKFHYDKFIP